MKTLYTYNEFLKEVEKLIRRKCCCVDVCATLQNFAVEETALAEGDNIVVITEEGCVLKPFDATGEIEVCTILQGLDDGAVFDTETDSIVTIRDDGETVSCLLTTLPDICDQLNTIENLEVSQDNGDLVVSISPITGDCYLKSFQTPQTFCEGAQELVDGGTFDSGTDTNISIRNDGETITCVRTVPASIDIEDELCALISAEEQVDYAQEGFKVYGQNGDGGDCQVKKLYLGYTVTNLTFADSPYTVLPTNGEHVYLVNTAGGDVVVNMPDASTTTAKYQIKKLTADANTIDITPNGVQTIDGDPIIQVTGQYDNVTIISDLSNLFII